MTSGFTTCLYDDDDDDVGDDVDDVERTLELEEEDSDSDWQRPGKQWIARLIIYIYHDVLSNP
jgi:hypothetical protein